MREGGGEDEPRAAHAEALKALSRRGRSEAELTALLLRNGFAPEVAERERARLAAAGLLDDRRFAAEWVSARGRRGYGRARLAAELAARGVEKETAEEALGGLFGPEAEREEASRALRKKAATLRKQGVELRAALYRFLRGRGFSPAAVSEALRAWEKETRS